jgi:HPt (histidine-containing phosphotransfer) domain-containing protein
MESAPCAARILIAVPEDLSRELVAQFLNSCREDLPRLHDALAASDYDRARRLGHQMKGTGSPYGFPDVTLIGSAIEQAAAARGAIELASQIQLLEAYLSLVEIAPGAEAR